MKGKFRIRHENMSDQTRMLAMSSSLMEAAFTTPLQVANLAIELIFWQFPYVNASFWDFTEERKATLYCLAVSGTQNHSMIGDELHITGEGCIEQAAREGKSAQILLPENPEEVRFKQICIPLVMNGEVFGVISIEAAEQKGLSLVDSSLFTDFASDVTRYYVQVVSFERLEQQNRRLHALRSVDSTLAGTADLQTRLQMLLQAVISETPADAAQVLLCCGELPGFTFGAMQGFRNTNRRFVPLDGEDSLAGRVLQAREEICIYRLSDLSNVFEHKFTQPPERFTACCVLPMASEGEITGVLQVFNRSRGEWRADWLSYLKDLSLKGAQAILSSRRYENLQHSLYRLTESYDELYEGFARITDLRGREPEGHIERMLKMTLQIARSMGVSEQDLVNIRRGTLLHDIGKIGIPEIILYKDETLTPEEWEIMKQHPQVGYELLSRYNSLVKALEIPYCHHERWDGSGYPRGLKGTEIPLAARIFAVADVWEALHTNRVYRKAWPEDRIIGALLAESGKHFDPDVIKVFMELYREGKLE